MADVPNKLSADRIKQLLAKPAPRRGGGVKRGVGGRPTEPREYATWWKLEQKFGDCDNPVCPDDRPHRTEDGNTIVALIDGKNCCRICFLDGWLSG